MKTGADSESVQKIVDKHFGSLVDGHAAAILLLIDVMPDQKNLKIVSATYGPHHYITAALNGAWEKLEPEPVPSPTDGYVGYENL